MTAQLQSPWLTFYDSDGAPLVGAKVRVYEPGTTTPLDVYSDEDVSTVVSQPFVTNAAGRIPRYFVTQKYRMTVHTSADVLVDDVDNQDPGLPSGFGVSATVQIAQGGTGATNAAAARTALGAASAASLTSVQDSITALQTAIAPGLNGDDELGAVAALASVSPDDMSGQTVRLQSVRLTTPSNTNVNSAIPFDTSKPQSGEGVLVFSQSFTPMSASSVLKITANVRGELAFTGTAYTAIALFLNNDADAVAASGGSSLANSSPHMVSLTYEYSPGSTSAITFKVRAGINTGTWTIGGSTITFGGLLLSDLVIEEYLTKA